MERADNELVPGIMQHSVSIAIQTTKEILIQEPLRVLLTVQLRNVLQSLNIANELIQFRAMNKLEKMALRVIADALSNREIAGLTEMFKMMDTNNNGQITYEDLKVEMQKVGAYLKESKIYDMMQAVRFKSWFSMLK